MDQNSCKCNKPPQLISFSGSLSGSTLALPVSDHKSWLTLRPSRRNPRGLELADCLEPFATGSSWSQYSFEVNVGYFGRSSSQPWKPFDPQPLESGTLAFHCKLSHCLCQLSLSSWRRPLHRLTRKSECSLSLRLARWELLALECEACSRGGQSMVISPIEPLGWLRRLV